MRNGVTKSCVCCQKDFYIPKYREATAKFCSLECQNHGQYKDRVTFTCEACKKTYQDSPSRKNRRFCSLECKASTAKNELERRRDSKKATRAARGVSHSRNTRKLAFAYYEKKCIVCKIDEHSFCLDVHHIDENPLNNAIENLAVLCVFCHRKLHKKFLSLI